MQNNEFHTVRGYQLQKQKKKLLTSAMEDYLEMIYRNIQKEGYMRINTLAELLNVKPSSATKMVQKLTAEGYLDFEKYGIIVLTESGKKLGKFLLDRHNIIEKFLKNIGVRENLLVETELIEHNISKNTLDNIEEFNTFLEMHPEIVKQFTEFKTKSHSKTNELE